MSSSSQLHLHLQQPSFWNRPDPAAQLRLSERLSARSREPSEAPFFWLLDGPPYANGELHLGHALNKFLKDAYARRAQLNGASTLWRAGWDCHGLPLELACSKRHPRLDRHSPEFLSACRAEATHWMGRQRDGFAQLGLSADLQSPWSTMDPAREARSFELLMQLWQAGLLVERHSPTHWCPQCRSALAASELESSSQPSLSCLGFAPFDDPSRLRLAAALSLSPQDELGLCYWTTTPWTLSSNRAFAMPLSGRVELLELAPGKLGLAFEDSLAFMERSLGRPLVSRGAVDAETLLDLSLLALRPLESSETSPLLGASFANTSSGSGFVHAAPAFGPEDFEWAEPLGLDLHCDLGPDGVFVSGRMTGLDRAGAASQSVDLLRQQGRLLAQPPHDLAVSLCWRHGCETFYRASRQWALDLDRPWDGSEGQGLRSRALQALESMRFLPDERPRRELRSMLMGRRFWTLSRDRRWGLPLPFVRNSSGEVDPALSLQRWQQTLSALRDGGLEAAARLPVPEGFAADTQCVDVWFDSGSAFLSASEREGAPDLVVEGADQTRGWFLSSMLLGAFASKDPVFKTVLCHGFVVDELGRKLSKSLGNAPDLSAQLQASGPDALRLWALSQSVGVEARWSRDSFELASRETRDWRGFLRFLMAQAMPGFQPMNLDHASGLDLLALQRLLSMEPLWQQAFDSGQPHLALRSLLEFRRWASSEWFELSKRKLYCSPLTDPAAQATRSAMAVALRSFLRWLDPFLPLSVQEARDATSTLAVDSALAPELSSKHLHLAKQASQALLERAQLQRLLELHRASDSQSKARYLAHGDKTFWLCGSLGVRPQDAVRGLLLAQAPSGSEWALQGASLHECSRCRGLFLAEPSGVCPDCHQDLLGWV